MELQYFAYRKVSDKKRRRNKELQIVLAVLTEKIHAEYHITTHVVFLETSIKIHIINVPSEIRILLPCYHCCCFREKDFSEPELQILCFSVQIHVGKRPSAEMKLPINLNS